MYEDIVAKAPSKRAQQRIRIYAECVESEETPESLLKLYEVKDLKELVQHLVEYECGSPYEVDDRLTKDYRLFWRTMNKVDPHYCDTYERETPQEREKIHLPCVSCGRAASTIIEGKPYCLMCAKAVV